MADINDITKALAHKYGGLDLEKKKPAERQAPREWDNGGYTPAASSASFPSQDTQQRLWPSERIILGAPKGKPAPKRPPVMMATFTDEELEQMLGTPAKRSWDFEVWLEVIGLPKDLHEKLDAPLFQYASRAYLKRKQEAHKQ